MQQETIAHLIESSGGVEATDLERMDASHAAERIVKRLAARGLARCVGTRWVATPVLLMPAPLDRRAVSRDVLPVDDRR